MLNIICNHIFNNILIINKLIFIMNSICESILALIFFVYIVNFSCNAFCVYEGLVLTSLLLNGSNFD